MKRNRINIKHLPLKKSKKDNMNRSKDNMNRSNQVTMPIWNKMKNSSLLRLLILNLDPSKHSKGFYGREYTWPIIKNSTTTLIP